MATKDQIVHALQTSLQDFQDGLIEIPGSDRILGFVVSSEFDAMTHQERQNRLYEVLETTFNKHDLLNLGPISTMTPNEAQLHQVED